jgi:quinolinate synthase
MEMEELRDKIERLKKERDAVVLAHYYVRDEVQAIADHVGDSYYLSKVASKAEQKVIVFCGVSFMGESAKIINPGKMVLMPDSRADCPMAHMVTPEEIEAVRAKYEDVAVVCYINSTAEIKTHADIIVTSSNALRITKALPQKNIYFIPDGNLGRHIAGMVPEKDFIFNDGYCCVHAKITKEDVRRSRAAHPGAPVLAHPECTTEVLCEADFIGSTSAMIEYSESCPEKEMIICTEIGILYEMRRRSPEKVFHMVKEGQICGNMKLITLEKVAGVLENLGNQVEIAEDVRVKAVRSLERMLEF